MNKLNVLNIVLLIAVFITGISVITVQDQSRQNFAALDKAQKQEIKLNQEYARLKLEQARLANHKLIKIAAEKQNLSPPSAASTYMIERRK